MTANALWIVLIATFLGLCAGSFWTVAAWRVGDDLWKSAIGRSRCDRCGHALGVVDLVPVLSYVLARGRCRYCGAAIGSGHLGAEIAGGAIGALAAGLVAGPAWIVAAALGWALLGLAMIDLDRMRLPDLMTLPLTAAGLMLAAGATLAPRAFDWLDAPTPFDALIAAAAGFGSFFALALIYEKLRGRAGLGGGDAKLMAAAGAWLGLEPLPFMVAGAGFMAILYAFARGGVQAKTKVPFGPPLCVGFFAAYLWARMG